MAMSEQQVRMMLGEYVKKEALEQELQNYVTQAEVPARMAPVADAKVAEAITTDEMQNKIAEIAKSAVTRLMEEGLQTFEDQITQLRNEVGDLTKLRNDVGDLKQKRTEKEEDDEKDDEKGGGKGGGKGDESDDENDDPKDKLKNQLREQVNQLKEQKGKEGDKDDKGKEKKSITMRREFIYLPKYTGKHDQYDDWKFKIRTFLNNDIEYVELLNKLDNENEIPTELRAKQIIEEVNAKCEVEEKDKSG